MPGLHWQVYHIICHARPASDLLYLNLSLYSTSTRRASGHAVVLRPIVIPWQNCLHIGEPVKEPKRAFQPIQNRTWRHASLAVL